MLILAESNESGSQETDSAGRDARHYVRPFGDYGHAGLRAVFIERLPHGRLDAEGWFHETASERRGIQPLTVDLDPSAAADLRQLLDLPLIHDEIVLAENPPMERFERIIFQHDAAE